MDKKKKTLKSPLSAKNTINPLHCEECKARVAGEAQRSIASEILFSLEFFKKSTEERLERIKELEKTLKGYMR